MRTGPYACSICNKKDSRKWNARRHNMIVHNNHGQVLDRLNNLVSTLPLSSSGDDSNPLYSNGVIQPDNKELNVNRAILYYRLPIKKTNKINLASDDEIYDEEIGKLGHVMDKLNDIMSDYPQNERDSISKMMIACAFSSADPVNTLKENISFLKKNKYSNKIRDCISLYCNVTPSVANEHLRKSLVYKYRYRNKSDTVDTDVP